VYNHKPYHIPILPSSGVRTLTLYSVFQTSDIFRSQDHVNLPLNCCIATDTKSTITANYPPCPQRDSRDAKCGCLIHMRSFNHFEHRLAESSLLLRTGSRYYLKSTLMMTIPPRLKFTRKPVILMMKMNTKTKIIQPYQSARIIEAEKTTCQRSPTTTKRRCLD
jgi:hypothetical protein